MALLLAVQEALFMLCGRSATPGVAESCGRPDKTGKKKKAGLSPAFFIVVAATSIRRGAGP
jgi:hypothetical protein